jgi:hypothetical protein
MEEVGIINFSEVGSETGSIFEGKFKVKTLLSRRDQFVSDEKRRFVLGNDSQAAPPALQGEAYMIAELSVRILEAPAWWTNSNSGLDLVDENLIPLLFEACLKEEKKRKEELKDKAKKALEQLAKG